MKAKQTQVAKATKQVTGDAPVVILSMKDAGFKFAESQAKSRDIAQWVLTQEPTFAEKVSDATREALYDGFAMKKHDLYGEDVYQSTGELNQLVWIGNTKKSAVIGNKIVKPITTIPEKAVVFSVYTALGYTGAEFGQLKKNDPVKHAILYEIRKEAMVYQSNRLKDLQKMAGKILDDQNPGQKTTRTEKLFTETVEKTFGDWAKQVRNKKEKRKDETAKPEKLKLAIEAFWKVYNG